jgi:hypothetical protein
MLNRTNFSKILVLGSSTLLSSLNVSGTSKFYNLNVKGNFNIDGTTTIIGTIIVNTTFSLLNVSGASTFDNRVTLLSSLNIVGNIIGSGTELTNLI